MLWEFSDSCLPRSGCREGMVIDDEVPCSILSAICFSATAFAPECAPPKVGKPLVQAKPKEPMAANLGTVRGHQSLWLVTAYGQS